MKTAAHVERMALALAHLYDDVRVAVDRAAHLFELLRDDCGRDVWAEAQRTLDVRKTHRRLGASDLDRDAALLGALREHVVCAFGAEPPLSNFEVFTALLRMGVPADMATLRTGRVA